MKLLAPLSGEQTLLPHFIRHYTALGVTEFYFTVQYETTLPPLPSNVHVRPYVGPPNHMLDARGMSGIQAEVIGPDEWFIVADGDEFARPPFPLREITEEADRRGCVWVLGRMVDRVAADGTLPAVTPEADLETLFPLKLPLTPIFGGPIAKAVLTKGRTEITAGHHYCDGRVLDVALEVDHYKWHAGVIERLEKRAKLYQELGFNWWVQSDTIVQHLRHHGRLDLDQLMRYV